ncbi:proline synthase co-transcribed bacterial -like protein [Brachionus plicatilis]|uniref:Pyridoxal phosphate homeostasis protein n=1 Tax=Brachionus plicatilis TaxID=10195 RepID=A0A3M7RBA5_BRAPC|nr:proline synthase co-transcribed bacterial -like protein [Brachionus plicatilis]
MENIAKNLKNVLEKIEESKKFSSNAEGQVRLVAVSKLKSIEHIIAAYQVGQRHFGENYVQELEEKSQSEKLQNSCPEIKWHFIGHLQSNKAKKVICLPNIFVIETVDSVKLADILNNASKTSNKIMNIMIQINTSNEPQKSGIIPSELEQVYAHIKNSCKNLNILGLMTIGSYEQSTNVDDLNTDFKNLIECKNKLVEKFAINPNSIELSMGMSHDFDQAVKMGSTNVRVGSLIFGSR